MPSTPDAVRVLPSRNNVLYGPGKAANAGGVIRIGSRNEPEQPEALMSREEVDKMLLTIMKNIHKACLERSAGIRR
jgi:glutamate dehydrogenase (NADP+)